MTRLISLRTSCTGATMSTHGAWTLATPPRAPHGGASPARSTLPCAGPTVSRAPGEGRVRGCLGLHTWGAGTQGHMRASAPPPVPRTPPAPGGAPGSPPLALVHLSPHPFLAPVTPPAIAASPPALSHTHTHTPQGLCACHASPTQHFPHRGQASAQTSLQRPLAAVRSTPPSHRSSSTRTGSVVGSICTAMSPVPRTAWHIVDPQ